MGYYIKRTNLSDNGSFTFIGKRYLCGFKAEPYESERSAKNALDLQIKQDNELCPDFLIKYEIVDETVAKKISFFDILKEKHNDVWLRLADCKNIKEDLPILVNIRWEWLKLKGKDIEGSTKEDALIQIFDLLDANSQYYLTDVSEEEYEELKR